MNRVRLSALMLLVLALALSFSSHASEAGKPTAGSGGGSTLSLTPGAVVPTQGEFGASATATVKAGRGQICFTTTIGRLSGYILTIGIYQGSAGGNGPMVLRLSPSPIGINQLNGCVPADDALVRDIARNPTHYYIQINTTLYPDGAVRAQL